MKMFNPQVWAALPFHFWTLSFFSVGTIVGSFLNVVIHRLPRGENIVTPPSHCPFCGYHIPPQLNIPLVTWLWLRGRCAQCNAPIPPRYFMVELLTGILFAACWLAFGAADPWVAVSCCLFFGLLIPATFIDIEHFIIPDGITLGGAVAGFLCSLVAPGLHGVHQAGPSLKASLIGMAVGGGFLYMVVRLGKLLFGTHTVEVPPGSTVVFGENGIILPDREMPYDEIFYRSSDTITVQADTVETADRCYWNVRVRLQPERLRIGDESFNPRDVPYMELKTSALKLPREAMGMGDVKFMITIGAFLGWSGALFAILASALIGSVTGVALIALRRISRANPLPYGPYLALGAGIWVFYGPRIVHWWLKFYEH